MTRRGLPDFGIAPNVVAASQPDIGAAVEWGAFGLARIDGLGRVVIVDNFSSGINNWTLFSFGAGLTPRALWQSSDNGWGSPICCDLRPNGTTTGDLSQIFRNFFIGEARQLGLEAALWLTTTSGRTALSLDYLPSGASAKIPALRINAQSGVIDVNTPSGFVTVTTIAVTGPIWLPVKVAADWATGFYMRAVIGDRRFDLSALALPVSPSADTGRAIASMTVTGNGGGASGPVRAGYAVLTRDEPE